MVKFLCVSIDEILEVSLLIINCEEEIVNVGIIECDGNMYLELVKLFNERGILKLFKMNVVIYFNDVVILGGCIYVDKYFIVILKL